MQGSRYYCGHPLLADEESEAQGGEIGHPSSHSQQVAELGFEQRSWVQISNHETFRLPFSSSVK